MELKEFLHASNIEQYQAVAKATIRALQDLGGQATRKEILEQIRTSDPDITEEIVDHQTKSRRTGNLYSKFYMRFSFKLMSLTADNIVERSSAGNYRLTKQGLKLDPDSSDFDAELNRLELKNQKQQKENIEEKHVENKTALILDQEDKEPAWRKELRNDLFNIDPKKFEILCRKLLSNMSVDIDENIGISYVADGGLDGFGYLTTDDLRTERIAIQAKRWTDGNNVSSPEIDKFRGAMDKFNAEYGVFITTSKFTRDAIQASRAGTKMITLIDGEKLIDMIVKYKVYVHETIAIEDFYKEN